MEQQSSSSAGMRGLGDAFASRVDRTIADRCLLDRSKMVVVALSGGPDSTCLLHVLHHLGYMVAAAHLDHGLRADSALDTAWSEQLCSSLGVPLVKRSIEVQAIKREAGGSIQVIAREERYRFLQSAAAEMNAGAIATGHTRSDRAESVLLNIVRGTGVEGLKGIPYRRDNIVRPLLDVERSDVESYCKLNELTPRDDPSNRSTKYARNNVRAELLPYLERRFNASVRDAIVRLSDIASDESSLLAELADKWVGHETALDVAQFAGQHIAMQRRILMKTLQCTPGTHAEVNHDSIERVRRAIASRLPFAIALPGADRYVQGNGMTFEVLTAAPAAIPERTAVEISGVGDYEFGNWIVNVSSLDAGFTSIGWMLRQWQPGDRIRLNAGSKKLQDIFTDAKVPRAERYTWPVVVRIATADDARASHNDEIIAVPNLCVAAHLPGVNVTAVKSG